MKLARQWKIEDGNLSDAIIGFIKNSKGKFKLIFEEWKEDRSSRQNRYYWAYLTIISQETGDTINDLHEYFKRKHLQPRFITAMGKEIKIPASTTKLTKEEFGKYIDSIELECGVIAPNPDDLYL